MASDKLQFWDKLLPNQTEYANGYAGAEEHLMQALFETIVKSSAIPEVMADYDLTLSEDFTIPEMGSNPIALRFLEIVTRLSKARYVLEIGTFIGLSAMNFARALPNDGKVLTFEKYEKFANIAKRNFKENDLDDKIEIIVGDALDEIANIPDDRFFDLIFIDGNKENYLEYFLALEKHLAPRGIVLVDDCFFHGDALNQTPQTEKGLGCAKFLAAAAERPEYCKLALPNLERDLSHAKIGTGAMITGQVI